MEPARKLKTIRAEVPTDGSAEDATGSGIKDTEALDTVIQNYAICELNAEQLTQLQEWVRQSKAAVDKANEEAKKNK